MRDTAERETKRERQAETETDRQTERDCSDKETRETDGRDEVRTERQQRETDGQSVGKEGERAKGGGVGGGLE